MAMSGCLPKLQSEHLLAADKSLVLHSLETCIRYHACMDRLREIIH